MRENEDNLSNFTLHTGTTALYQEAELKEIE